jgi:hypothetical protein
MKELTPELYRKAMATLIARAWLDQNYKERLASDPVKALAEVGIPAPERVKINVHFNSDSEFNLIIPAPPSANQITEADFVSASAQVAAHEQLVLPTILLRKATS